MIKEIRPERKRNAPPKGVRNKPYVRFTSKMLYISSAAMRLLGETEYVSLSINAPERFMIITHNGPWKLCRVNEAKDARRIETNGGLLNILEAGFPKGMLGKYLMCHTDMMGALVVSLIPDYEVVKDAEQDH